MFKIVYKVLFLLIVLVLSQSCDIVDQKTVYYLPKIEPKSVVSISKKVLEEQIKEHPKQEWKNDWFNAALFHGITESAKTFDDSTYWRVSRNWAEYHDWKIGSRKFHADDQSPATAYLNLYEHYKQQYMLADFKQAVDSLETNFSTDELLWHWCDALYMAPVPISKLGHITGENKYFDLVNKHFWKTYELLYDEKYHLFYRDKRFLNREDRLGNPVFWSRGNGWVIAGLVGILKHFPERNVYYNSYRILFKSMMSRIIELQEEDGLWRSNLLSPSIFPHPETSGTAFFTYGLAWGIRTGLLKNKKYGQSLEKAWKGLMEHVNEKGKLGAAQSADIGPDSTKLDNSELFATGGFLLATAEIYKLLSGNRR